MLKSENIQTVPQNIILYTEKTYSEAKEKMDAVKLNGVAAQKSVSSTYTFSDVVEMWLSYVKIRLKTVNHIQIQVSYWTAYTFYAWWVQDNRHKAISIISILSFYVVRYVPQMYTTDPAAVQSLNPVYISPLGSV